MTAQRVFTIEKSDSWPAFQAADQAISDFLSSPLVDELGGLFLAQNRGEIRLRFRAHGGFGEFEFPSEEVEFMDLGDAVEWQMAANFRIQSVKATAGEPCCGHASWDFEAVLAYEVCRPARRTLSESRETLGKAHRVLSCIQLGAPCEASVLEEVFQFAASLDKGTVEDDIATFIDVCEALRRGDDPKADSDLAPDLDIAVDCLRWYLPGIHADRDPSHLEVVK